MCVRIVERMVSCQYLLQNFSLGFGDVALIDLDNVSLAQVACSIEHIPVTTEFLINKNIAEISKCATIRDDAWRRRPVGHPDKRRSKGMLLHRVSLVL